MMFTLWFLGYLGKTIFDDLFNFAGDAGGETVTVTNTVGSPDGEYIATTHVEMGGGAAGWCFQRVSVNKKDSPFSWEKEKVQGGFNFDVSCKSKIELNWQTNRELLVSYSGTSDEAGLSVYQKPLSADRQVKIHYLAKP